MPDDTPGIGRADMDEMIEQATRAASIAPERRTMTPHAALSLCITLSQLADMAREVHGHVTLHASYGREAERHPDPDWSCQLVWVTNEPANPVLAYYGTGADLQEAAASVVTQITEALAALAEDTP